MLVSGEWNIETEAFIHVRFTLKRTTPKILCTQRKKLPHVQPYFEWKDDGVSSRIQYTCKRDDPSKKKEASASADAGQNKCETHVDEKKESEAANVIRGSACAQNHIKKTGVGATPDFAASTAASHTAFPLHKKKSGTDLDRRIMCNVKLWCQVDPSLEI